MCKCITCYGSPDSGVTCSDTYSTPAERAKTTIRNMEILAETGRNFETTALLTDHSA